MGSLIWELILSKQVIRYGLASVFLLSLYYVRNIMKWVKILPIDFFEISGRIYDYEKYMFDHWTNGRN